MNIKKLLITCLIIIPVGVLTSCSKNNDKTVPENKTLENQIPENTLAIFEINYKTYDLQDQKETYFLQYVQLTELEEVEKEMIVEGDFYLRYGVITGNYPRTYDFCSSLLHIIPEDSVYRIKSRYENCSKVKEYEEYEDINPILIDRIINWSFVGYSNNENLLEAKVLKYYLENIDTGEHRISNKAAGKKTKNRYKTFTLDEVEQKPEFPGGDKALLAYLNKKLKYPADALEQGIEGRVPVRFAVLADGSITNVTVIRRLHPSCDEEAVRLITKMPKWKPGKHFGTPVNVYSNCLKVDFRLQ